MSLVPVVVDIERDIEVDDFYGGAIAQQSIRYARLQAWVNYPHRQAVDRSESVTYQGATGPGVETRTKGICKFEPPPRGIEILVNDRVEVRGGDTWLVVGVRKYEYTLQLNMELIEP